MVSGGAGGRTAEAAAAAAAAAAGKRAGDGAAYSKCRLSCMTSACQARAEAVGTTSDARRQARGAPRDAGIPYVELGE